MKKCPICMNFCIYRLLFVYSYKQKKTAMIIKLVSRSCIDNMQYYDAIVCSNYNEIFLTDVYYNVRDHVWSAKFPNKPLFKTILFSDMINYLTEYVRDLFYS